MALTPSGTPYVESSDLVANYPATSLSLANKVDTKANTASPTFTGTVTIPTVNLLAWTSYTPTITNFVLGNGTVNAAYAQIGKVIHLVGKIVWGSTSTFSASSLIVSAPVAFQGRVNFAPLGRAAYQDASLNEFYSGTFQYAPGTGLVFQKFDNGTPGKVSGTNNVAPFTWATSDVVWFSGTHETT